VKSALEFGPALSFLRERIATSDLLPGGYARYRPLLADGLVFFLERLSAARLRRIFAEQMRLGPSVSTAERIVILLHHVPALHKLGQVLARDRRLHPDFRQRLQRLESLPPRIPPAEVIALLQHEFPNWRKAGIKLAPEPLAEGSVAVILPFTCPSGCLRPRPRRRRRNRNVRPNTPPFFDYDYEAEDEDGKEKTPQSGVFKLLKPGIQTLLEQDLEVLGLVGDFLDEDRGRYHLPALDYRDTFETIRQLLLHEVRLDQEQQNLAEAAKNYSGVESVQIPALLPFCTPRLTAMTRLYGHKLTTGFGPEAPSRRALALTAAEALIARPLFSPQPAALFHADPHAGNLLMTLEGRLGILDWSLTARLHKQDRVQLLQLVLGALTLDVEQMEAAVVRLAAGARGGFRQVLEDSLRPIRRGLFPGILWLANLLEDLMVPARLHFNADLLLFRKSLLTLEGVLADLTGEDDTAQRQLLDQALFTTLLRQWQAEWPARVLAPWQTRSFATHLSTQDLLRCCWSAPATFWRWWGQTLAT
jgi:ubiquinone biosynthesis protein